MNLKDKVVVVTGATGGIGEILCKELDKVGVKLLMVSRTKDKLETLRKELEGAEHTIFAFDFTNTDKLAELSDNISKVVEKVNALINTAGVGVYKNVEDVDLSEWENSVAINVTAPFFLTKKLLPLLRKSEKSVVINIGSGMGNIPTPCRSVYCATKYALRGMTLSLAAEFRGSNVNFIHLALGSVLTDFGPMSLKEKEEENLKGKAYLTPEWVSRKIIEILKSEKYDQEITLFPTDYSDSKSKS